MLRSVPAAVLAAALTVIPAAHARPIDAPVVTPANHSAKLLGKLGSQPLTAAQRDRRAAVRSYTSSYQTAKRKLGAQAVGRDIASFGVRDGRQQRAARTAELRDSTQRLRMMVAPPPAPAAPSATATATGGGPSGLLVQIAQCESGGDPAAVSPDGQYRGMYQFSRSTWESVGGVGDPAGASVAEQTHRAEILLATAGAGQWPHCGS